MARFSIIWGMWGIFPSFFSDLHIGIRQSLKSSYSHVTEMKCFPWTGDIYTSWVGFSYTINIPKSWGLDLFLPVLFLLYFYCLHYYIWLIFLLQFYCLQYYIWPTFAQLPTALNPPSLMLSPHYCPCIWLMHIYIYIYLYMYMFYG